jgi:lantibiotic modifying enzyme
MNAESTHGNLTSSSSLSGTDTPFLEPLLNLAHNLAHNARLLTEGVPWEADDLVGDDYAHRIVRVPIGPGMYDGKAGIGWFLAHVAPFDASGAIAAAADAALRAALSEAHENLEPETCSLMTGALGTALTAWDAGACLADSDSRRPTLQQAASALAEAAAAQIMFAPPAAYDLIAGAAGMLVGLLALYQRTAISSLLAAVHTLGDSLLASAHKDWWGASWTSSPGVPALCGLAHGNAGVGWALAELAWIAGERRYLDVAYEAFRYERSWYAPDRCAWPDLRQTPLRNAANSTWPGWMTAWCHGALGIGAVRLRFYEMTHDTTALAEASAAINAARMAAGRAGAALSAGEMADVTLCHGLGGVAELLLLAYEVLGGREHLRAARQVGRLCLDIFAANGSRWTTGLQGAEDVPGLFLGRAGIGVTLLRLHDPGLVGSPALPGRMPYRPAASIFTG